MIILIFPLVGFNVLEKTNVQYNVNLYNYIVCKCFLFENFAYLFVICITSTWSLIKIRRYLNEKSNN